MVRFCGENVMKMAAMLALGAISLSACATNSTRAAVEQGYERGALAVAAIDRGDWSRAETLLQTSKAGREDPARLINLGAVYMETDRPGEALSAWRLALSSPDHFMVETIDGRVISTDELAREAIARHERKGLMASR